MKYLARRAEERASVMWWARRAVVLFVSLLVLARLVTYAFSTFHLVNDEVEPFRAWTAAGTAFAAALDVIILLLIWGLFEMLSRIEREADRLQAFMDNVYRRLP